MYYNCCDFLKIDISQVSVARYRCYSRQGQTFVCNFVWPAVYIDAADHFCGLESQKAGNIVIYYAAILATLLVFLVRLLQAYFKQRAFLHLTLDQFWC